MIPAPLPKGPANGSAIITEFSLNGGSSCPSSQEQQRSQWEQEKDATEEVPGISTASHWVVIGRVGI